MAAKNKKYVDKYKPPNLLGYDVNVWYEQRRNGRQDGVKNGDRDGKVRWGFRGLHNPRTLVELTTEVLDRQPLPACTYWTTPDVLRWLDSLQLPQYKSVFRDNFITGRQLILLSPDHLVKMNIHNFDDIKKIMIDIRRLYQVPMPKFARDLTKPVINATEYDWNTLYYRYIAWLNPENVIPRSEYWSKAKMIQIRSTSVCHWYSIAADRSSWGKMVVARVVINHNKITRYIPMFREGHFTPTTMRLDYLEDNLLTW